MKLIKNVTLVTPTKVLEATNLVFDTKIRYIDREFIKESDYETIIDGQNKILIPGLIDIHMHGSMGIDIMNLKANRLGDLTEKVLKFGVARFLATTITTDSNSMRRVLANIKDIMMRQKTVKAQSAIIEGIHLEGPFINTKFKGCHEEKYIQSFDGKLIEDYFDIIKIITVAPEKQSNMKQIKDLANKHQFILSMGHTGGSYDELIDSINDGVTHATHLFNAMSSLNHRQPGAVGVALTSDITTEIIADNIHIHPSLYKLIYKCKGADKIILITDSISATGIGEGKYLLGNQEIFVDKYQARLKDGTLAGSILTLNRAIKNFYEYSGASLNEVVNMATLNPAKLLNIDHITGSIEEGKLADLVLVDHNFNVCNTIIAGEVRFEA